MDQAGAEQQVKRKWAETDAQTFHLNIRKNSTVQWLHVALIAQRSCGVSLSGDIPEPSGCNPCHVFWDDLS